MMNKITERLYNGIIKENPTFVLTLGMCPTLAVTTSAINGLGMGLTTAVVLALSNLIISLLRKIIPDKVRIPAFIVIVASFVTMVQLLLEAYLPSLNAALGIYIPLIVVNCIILGRAESYAYHNGPAESLFDGIGMGLGFTVALTMIGLVREILGSGSAFGHEFIPEAYHINIFVLAPGAFFVLAALTAIQNAIKIKLAAKGKDVSKIGSGCGNCAECGSVCEKAEKKPAKKETKKEEPEKTESVNEEPAKEEQVKEEAVKTEPVQETPAEKEPISEAPAEETPIEETPAEEAPAPAEAPKKKFSLFGKKKKEVRLQIEYEYDESDEEDIDLEWFDEEDYYDDDNDDFVVSISVDENEREGKKNE